MSFEHCDSYFALRPEGVNDVAIEQHGGAALEWPFELTREEALENIREAIDLYLRVKEDDEYQH